MLSPFYISHQAKNSHNFSQSISEMDLKFMPIPDWLICRLSAQRAIYDFGCTHSTILYKSNFLYLDTNIAFVSSQMHTMIKELPYQSLKEPYCSQVIVHVS